jgi:hypothetical protein
MNKAQKKQEKYKKYFSSPVRLWTLAVLSFFMIFAEASADAAANSETTRRLAEERTSVCWVEGQFLDELVLNARGKLTFIYVDSRLGESLRKLRNPSGGGAPSNEFPEIVMMHAAGYANRKGQALFVLLIEASKPWTFDTGKIFVGDYAVNEGDISRGVNGNPRAEIQPGTSELPSGYSGCASFFVPKEYIEPGAAIRIGYGDDSAEWTAPKK